MKKAPLGAYETCGGYLDIDLTCFKSHDFFMFV